LIAAETPVIGKSACENLWFEPYSTLEREDAAEDDPNACFFPPQQPCRYPQLYLLDPDRNIIEINGAA
jgi:hypothetical protein